jgi:hypothetical protein
MTNTYPTREEVIAGMPRYPYRNGETGTICDLAYHLKSAEDRAWGYEQPCVHTKHDQHCPVCRFNLAVADYTAAAWTEIWRRRGGVRPHDPETIKELEAAAEFEQREYDLIVAAKYKRKIDIIDAAIESDYAKTLLSRSKFAARMADQKAERRARRTGNIKRTAITDGYMRTGKTTMLDGERVPVVRKVEFSR